MFLKTGECWKKETHSSLPLPFCACFLPEFMVFMREKLDTRGTKFVAYFMHAKEEETTAKKSISPAKKYFIKGRIRAG